MAEWVFLVLIKQYVLDDGSPPQIQCPNISQWLTHTE